MSVDQPSFEGDNPASPAGSRKVEQPIETKTRVVANLKWLSPQAEERLSRIAGSWKTFPSGPPPLDSNLVAETKRLLSRQQYAAKKSGQCPAVVNKRRVRGAFGVEKRVCGAEATRKGFCRIHYNKKFLMVPANQAGGSSGRFRPFADWQLPGHMSDAQHDCLAALPLNMGYLECIEVMNAADPGNLLIPITEKSGSRKSKAWK